MSSVKSKSKVTHATPAVSLAHASPAAPPSNPAADAQEVVAATPGDLTTQAAQAVAALRTMSAALPIDDALPPKDLKAALSTNRVPLKALMVAADILEAAPAQYPHFDAQDARSSIEYEQAMTPVAEEAQALSDRIKKSVLKRRSKNATQALVLYGTLKALSRLPAHETTRGQVKQLTKFLKTYTQPRAQRVTKKELKVAEKGVRRTKVAKVKANELAVATQAAVTAATEAGLATPPPPAPSPEPAAPPPPAAPPVTK